MTKYLLGLVIAITGIIGGYQIIPMMHSNLQSSAPKLGETNNFKFAQLQPYYLSGGGAISGATTITLKSMKDIDGNTLTMSAVFGTKGFGTIEPGNGTQEEQISFSGLTNNSNGTVTLTGVKSVTFVYPYTETSGLAKTHPGSATFVISNTSGFYNQLMSPINNATITASYLFSSTSPPSYDSVAAQASGTYISTTSEFASIAYVNTISFSGTSNATEGVKGISQFATRVESASSTILGTTGAGLVLQARYATSSPGSAGLWTVITNNAGKIAQAFLDWTQNIAFSGTNTHSGNETFSGNTILNSSSASTTIVGNLIVTGNVTSSTTPLYVPFAGNVSAAASSPTTTLKFVKIPANTFTIGKTARITGTWTTTSTCYAGILFGNGTATTTIGFSLFATNSGHFSGQVFSTMYATSSASQFSSAFGFNPNGTTPNLWEAFTAYDLTGTTYINFTGNTVSGACSLIGGAIEFIST